jgi:hypothetical protein
MSSQRTGAKRNQPGKSGGPGLFSRLVHTLLLAGWLVSVDGVMPGLWAVLAGLQDEHHLAVSRQGQGGIRLMLKDGDASGAARETLDHDWLSRLLVALARDTDDGGAGHEIGFKNLDEPPRSRSALFLAVDQDQFVFDPPVGRLLPGFGWPQFHARLPEHSLRASAIARRLDVGAGLAVRESRTVMIC